MKMMITKQRQNEGGSHRDAEDDWFDRKTR
jgi:hypothetical protein